MKWPTVNPHVRRVTVRVGLLLVGAVVEAAAAQGLLGPGALQAGRELLRLAKSAL